MKMREAIALLPALTSLDGRQRVVLDGGVEKIVTEPYRFSANTRMAIARNVAALQAEQVSFNAARNGIIMQMSGGAGKVPDDKVPAFQAELLSLMEADCDGVSMRKISEADLNLAENPIPPSVLAELMPILAD